MNYRIMQLHLMQCKCSNDKKNKKKPVYKSYTVRKENMQSNNITFPCCKKCNLRNRCENFETNLFHGINTEKQIRQR